MAQNSATGKTRTVYKKKWLCINPGRWRSDCGWYEVIRVQRDLWIGVDLTGGKANDGYSSTMVGAIWQIYGQDVR